MRTWFRRTISRAEQAAEQAPSPDASDLEPAPSESPSAHLETAEESAKPRRRGTRGGGGRKKKTEEVAPAEAAPSTPAAKKQGKRAAPKGSAGEKADAPKKTRRRSETTRRSALPALRKEMLVSIDTGEQRVAVLEDGQVVEVYLERPGRRSIAGNVYKGTVDTVLPGMEASFVDIGLEKNGFLYVDEIVVPELEGKRQGRRIQDLISRGQDVVVQAVKDPMGTKGARLTTEVSLPGRFLVYTPFGDGIGVSRRLDDEERDRLKAICRTLELPEGGIIVRTAAEGASEEAITHDLQRLIAQWDTIQKQAKKVKAPDVLSEEPELTVRVVRDLFTDEEYKALVTDSPRVYDKVMDYVRDVAPDLAPKVSLHEGKLPAFEEHRIEEQIHKALDRKVWLPSGGYLIIERTEAMTIVDVNTGKSVGKTNLEATVANTNLEAAKEVARQLRLRDIGGIIVIDFIDMLLEKNKDKVVDTLKTAMAQDKTRSQVFDIGPLGLAQVTRKRVSAGLLESFSETCPTCEGRGILLTYKA